jgi:molybdenum cofactor biosynthesis enzyme MoaA
MSPATTKSPAAPPMGRGPARVARLDALAAAGLDPTAAAAAVPLEGGTAGLAVRGPCARPWAVAVLQALAARGAERIALWTSPGVLEPALLRDAGGVGRRLVLRCRIEATDGAARARLLELAGAAVAAGVSLELTFVLLRATLAAAPGLVPLLWSLPSGPVSFGLDLPGPGDAGTEAVALSALDGLPREVHDFVRWRGHVDSRVGRPLCRFPDTLERVLTPRGPGGPGPLGDAAFGPDCGACVLRPSCTGVTADYARAFGFEGLRPFVSPEAAGAASAPETLGRIPWETKLRWLLRDRPGIKVRLGDVVPARLLPALPCTMPWTRLELHDGDTFGPCCADWIRERHFVGGDPTPARLWDGPVLRAFRAAMRAGAALRTCRPSCPVLTGGTERPADLRLPGGPPEAVEDRIRLVRALLDGREAAADFAPLSICVATTTGCNYDCVMCDCGQTGRAEDERPRAFWDGLAPWLHLGVEVDANGGEPLLSPTFRAFVEEAARSGAPPSIAMTTNASLLTPKWLDGLGRSPFRSLIVSLNSTRPDTYRAVHRGLPLKRVRANLDHLLELRRQGRFTGGLTYSMVVLRRNLAEVRDFATLALADGAEVRYLLPMRDRNGQSVLTDAGLMRAAAAALEDAAATLEGAGLEQSARRVRATAQVVRDRLAAGTVEAL